MSELALRGDISSGSPVHRAGSPNPLVPENSQPRGDAAKVAVAVDVPHYHVTCKYKCMA
jgi:hypothetical protein